jgi:hypothetical protein
VELDINPLFPQRRMVAHYRAMSERYLRAAGATSNDRLREFALACACDYDDFARQEERAILKAQS